MNQHEADIEYTQAQTRLFNAQAKEVETALESDCTRAYESTFGIGKAVKTMQNGGSVARTSWADRGQFLQLQVPDDNSGPARTCMSLFTKHDQYIKARGPWFALQSDILATDWYEVSA